MGETPTSLAIIVRVTRRLAELPEDLPACEALLPMTLWYTTLTLNL